MPAPMPSERPSALVMQQLREQEVTEMVDTKRKLEAGRRPRAFTGDSCISFRLVAF